MHIASNTTFVSDVHESKDVFRGNEKEEHFPFHGHRSSAREGNLFKEPYTFSTSSFQCKADVTASEARSNSILELKVKISELDAKLRKAFVEAAVLLRNDDDQGFRKKMFEGRTLYDDIRKNEKALRRLERGRTIEKDFQSGTRFRNVIKGIAKLAFTSRNLPPQPRAMQFCEVAAAEAESRSDQHL